MISSFTFIEFLNLRTGFYSKFIGGNLKERGVKRFHVISDELLFDILSYVA